MKSKEMTEVLVDGVLEIREIDYVVRRDEYRWEEYPVLKAGEHIYENNTRYCVVIICQKIVARSLVQTAR